MTTVDRDRYCLAIDLGTGGPKVGFVTLAGQMVWSTHREVKTEFLPHGGAEQDASVWWDVIRDAIREGVGNGGVDASRVAAVSVTGQWASTVPVDANGVPVGPCVMWMDTRGGKHVRDRVGGPAFGYAPRAALSFIRKTGGAPSPTGADPIGHMLWLQHDAPDVHKSARWYLEPVDYLSMRFTGVAAASHASMTAAWLTDNRALDRMAYDSGLVKLVGLDAGKLPPLVPTGSVVGTVHTSVARELGLPDGVQVVTGTPDLHTAACGAGGVTDYQTHMAISTTSWISCPVADKKTDAIRQIATVPGLSPERYLIADNHDTSGLAFQWLRDNVVTGLDFTALTALAADSPAGSGGVIFTPWLQGERSPIDDRNARGGFHNLSINTSKGDIVRSVLEGVAYNDRWLLEAVEKFTGRRLDPIRIVGGGAQSDLWCQIHADVMDRTIERIDQPYFAQLRGAAIFAGLGLGAVQPDEVRGLVEVDRTFTPTDDTRATYDELYGEFPGLYKAQKDMFKRLNRRKRS